LTVPTRKEIIDAVSPLAAVAEALAAVCTAEVGLRTAVDRARAAGSTWAEIGEALGTSRQAAFQRFGRPGAWRPMDAGLLPGAAGTAVALVPSLAEGVVLGQATT
jgi:hypothetical protein